MKILQIVHGFPPKNIAGTEVYASNLSSELAKNHEVFVFHRINNPRKKEFVAEEKTLDGLTVFTINNTFRKCASFEETYKNNKISEAFGKILDRTAPDIVHIQHLLYLSFGIIEEVKKRKIPIVFTLHDYLLFCPQGQLLRNNIFVCSQGSPTACRDCIPHLLSIQKSTLGAYFLMGKIFPDPLVQLCKKIYLYYTSCTILNNGKAEKLLGLRNEYIKGICAQVDLFLSPSRFLKEKFVDFGIPSEKIIHSPYGFNTGSFQAIRKNSSRWIRFAFIGNMMPAKGLHVLIQAFNKTNDDNVELKIYGKESSYKGRFLRYLKTLKKNVQNKNIRFMGGFDNSKIAEIFESIDVLVVPSIWQENAPLVIQEAFLAKTPVIASRIGGIPELVQDHRNGLLFEPGNPLDLYNKIQMVIDTPGYIDKLKENIPAVKSIEEDSLELEKIYRSLTGWAA